MKFPISMLRDYVQTSLTADEVGDLLTMAGFELEGIEDVAGEPVLDIKVVSNRGDGLSVFGLAREILAKDATSKATDLYSRAANFFGDVSPSGSFELPSNAATLDSADCLRFAVRGFEGVDAKASAPAWMQDRLNQAGMRSISILVDLTNYVMLELGQPLHAFDRAKLTEGRIVIRHAQPGEKLTTLNGLEHELMGQMMICDGANPVGVPGVMGGLDTEVSDSTTSLLLESANFRNTMVRKTRKQLGLNTEASYRFERSVDPEGVIRAILRFSELLLESQPGVTASNILDIYPPREAALTIPVRLNRANRLLGMEISAADSERYLRNLGFSLTTITEPEVVFNVTAPSWRPDITREIDLVEELGRIHGYEKIPEELPVGHTPVGGAKGEYLDDDLLREAAVRAGFVQIWSHSLRDLSPLDSASERIGPRNPSSPETSYLRNSLLPSLADAVLRNGGKDLHLFEVGKVFSMSGGKFIENKDMCLWSVGALLPQNRAGEKLPEADFYSLKQTVTELGKSLGLEFWFILPEKVDHRLHPSRQALFVNIGGDAVGSIGQIHPDIAEQLGVSPHSVLATINVDSLFDDAERTINLRTISRNPSVRRDISFEIGKSVPFLEVERALQKACEPELEKQWLFDVYEGKGIAEGHHSLTVALQLRKQGENFTDEEANLVRERAVAALAALGAKPR